jgi:cyclopropane fatty-acyl-phospholipid synthase-like methyltransferase
LPDELAARRWDAEYRRGRYVDEPPLPFVDTILDVLGDHSAIRAGVGLYVGCGNGRNYLPLVDAGLTLYGLDLSSEALRQLAARRPALSPRLLRGAFQEVAPPAPLAYLVAIQVFQHGAGAEVAAAFDRVAALLPPGGLFFLRVNSAATQVIRAHVVTEREAHGGFSLRYLDGPKDGMSIHFFAREELDALTRARFAVVRAPGQAIMHRAPPERGFWAQWEAVYRRC